MINVAVLLSAYNGDKFIKEQIESILNQNGVNVKLTIRNDGGDPEEKTRRIIREYVAKDERESLLEGRPEYRWDVIPLNLLFLAAVAGGAGGGLFRFCRPGRRMAAR